MNKINLKKESTNLKDGSLEEKQNQQNLGPNNQKKEREREYKLTKSEMSLKTLQQTQKKFIILQNLYSMKLENLTEADNCLDPSKSLKLN